MALGFTSYVVENDEKVARAFERAAAVSKNLKVPFTQISKDFYKSRKAIFALQGPGLYEDLKPRTKDFKLRTVGFIYPILKLTGRLEGSVTSQTHPDNITNIGDRALEMGTKVPYAGFHQEGQGQALRKFLFIGPESQRYSDDVIKGFPKRTLNTLNTFVIRELGESMEAATGVKPKIKKGRA